jgi:hypothetical protein
MTTIGKFTQHHFEVITEVLRYHRAARGDTAELREISEAFARTFARDNPRFSRARFLSAIGITGPNQAITLDDREQFFYDHLKVRIHDGSTDEERHARRARRAIELAAAEWKTRPWADSGAEVTWQQDPERDVWDAFLYQDGDQMGHKYDVRLKSVPEKDPYARVIAAELAADCL